MTGILGRMAAESGKKITWDEAMASNLELAPGLDKYTMDSNPPVMPDAQGRYPVAMPGQPRCCRDSLCVIRSISQRVAPF